MAKTIVRQSYVSVEKTVRVLYNIVDRHNSKHFSIRLDSPKPLEGGFKATLVMHDVEDDSGNWRFH